MSKVWFITGAARGVGKSIADAALKNGDSVIATTRKANDFTVPEGYEDQILTFQLDVANTDQAVFDDAVKQAVDNLAALMYW